MTTLSVLGCGWLGAPLASRFISKGFNVYGSTTTAEKLEQLKSKGINPFLLNFLPQINTDPSDFFQRDILFVNIPFRRDLVDPSFYQQQMRSVLDCALVGKTRWIIFASSTLVYPSQNQVANEDEAFDPPQGRAQILYDVEQMFLSNPSIPVTIVRFAGLYGPGRPFGGFIGKVAGRSALSRVNLIHLDDCLGIIEAIVDQGAIHQVFNAVSDEHPTRLDLYQMATQGLSTSSEAFKIVSNAKIKAVLQYRLIHPNPLLDR